ncbi:hypothetical protein AB6A40_007906 [Gnathostoma spinigerum]|uniref:Glutathione S-transferase n=1 Tax=Gnathostoma spinigerum TaxID=75299 RepID=A0ABD6EWZ6_9BILA
MSVISRQYSSVKPDIHKNNWKPDVVYLYQFPRLRVIPQLSPYCLKLETWLRVSDIEYENCFTWIKRSSEGLLPFIELNGEHIADSQLIISRLQRHFMIHEGLSGEEKAVGRAIDRMIEGNTFYALLYFKSVENWRNLANREILGVPLPSFVLQSLFLKISRKIEKMIWKQGIGRHCREDIVNILRKDVEAISTILGDKKFLFGIRPTVADCTVFGHFASTYYLPFRQPIVDLLDEEFPRVKAHLQRMRSHYFPEWKLD